MTKQLEYRRILVATDLSPASTAALNQAVWVARESGGLITLVHVLPDMRQGMHNASIDAKLDLLYGEGGRFYKELRGDADQRLRSMIDAAGAKDVEIRPKILLGKPIVEICRAAQQLECDLVMAGTRGVSGWQAFFIGGTARRLIRNCSAPVWVVKPQHAGKPQAVLAATDFSEISRRAVLAGMAIAADAAADFHLLHVIDSSDVPENVVAIIPEGSSLRQEINDAAKHRFEEFVASLQAKSKMHPHLSWGTPWQEVNRLAGELHVDLITIGTVGRSGIPGLFLGNTPRRCSTTVIAAFSLLSRPASSRRSGFWTEGAHVMKRYVVTNQSTGVTHVLCDSIAEALYQAVKLQDEGSRVLVIDSQGSGVIMADHFDVLEAEGYLGRGLGNEKIDQPVPIADVIAAARQTARDKQMYHWDISNSDIR